MKKIIQGLLLVTLIFTIAACTPRNKEEEPKVPQDETKITDETGITDETDETDITDETNITDETDITEGKYKDGEYRGEGNPWEYGAEDATVVIKDGKITDITLRRLDKEGNEVNYNDWTGEEKNGKTYPNLKQYRMDLAKEMVDKQTYEVDSISGATVSSDNWKMAVKRALEKAEQ